MTTGLTWTAIAGTLAAFLALFAALQSVARTTRARPETTRKVLHVGSGALTVAFPFLFRDLWPVLLLTGSSALIVSAIKFVPTLRDRFGSVANRVERPTLGEIYFPVSIAVLFWLTRRSQPLLFIIPVLILTVADTAGALVGSRYGATPWLRAGKSLEGSAAFAAAAFVCVHIPLLLWSQVNGVDSMLIGAAIALPVTLIEASARRGLDNLFIPIGGWALLRICLVS